MKTLILITLLFLAGCSGHTLALIYQYQPDTDVKIETTQKPKQTNNVGNLA